MNRQELAGTRVRGFAPDARRLKDLFAKHRNVASAGLSGHIHLVTAWISTR